MSGSYSQIEPEKQSSQALPSAAAGEKMTNLTEIARAGIVSTPAVSIGGRPVVSGQAPGLARWLLALAFLLWGAEPEGGSLEPF